MGKIMKGIWLILAASFLGGAVLGVIVMWLWNWLIPSLTNGLLTKITWLQGAGLVVLFNTLTGGLLGSSNFNIK